MSDRYLTLVGTPAGGAVARRLGLPMPTVLRRYEPGQELLVGPALLAAVGKGPLLPAVTDLLLDSGCTVETAGEGAAVYGDAAASSSTDSESLGAVVVDASEVQSPEDLEVVRALLAPSVRRLAPSGRVLVLGAPAEESGDLVVASVRRALDGLVRSLAKELRGGATANLLLVRGRGGPALVSAARFLLSARSAYVDGQVLRVDDADVDGPEDVRRPLAGRVAVVTGAARGIGAAIASTLARDGARVVCVDVPAAGEALAGVANEVGGTALQLDVTAPDAPGRLVEHLRTRTGGAHVVVHNAGITRDRLLVNADAERWNAVLEVNLAAPLRLTQALLDGEGALGEDARIVCISSTSGIAGNRGQTSYAASKAGLIGMVQALAPVLAVRGGTANAVAPGFIETEMTARMPLATREAARRLSSLAQGGSPLDVAEAVAWLGQRSSGGVNGQVLRVCGQSLVGA